jgi:mRNA deadenylase 3'-5' endonuclease subunit Ccr4
MLGKHFRVGPLNARSIFKASNPALQRKFISHLRNRSLSLDILCLQEISHFRADQFSDAQVHDLYFSFSSFFCGGHQALCYCLSQTWSGFG